MKKTENTSPSTNQPSHGVFHVRERTTGESFWTRIGSAWAHADGMGLNVQLDCIPVDGRLTLRVPAERSS